MTAAPLIFSAVSVGATLGGAHLILRRPAWAEAHLWRILAFGSGVLLAMTFLHLLPEAWGMNPRWASAAVLAALGGLFVLEEFTVVHACGEVAEHCVRHHVGYGALAALFLHSLADGLAIAFAFQSSERLGTAVALAVVVHKFSDGMTLSSLFLGAGHAPGRAGRLSTVLSLATPLGVLTGGFLGPRAAGPGLAVLLGLADGGFLYVSMADVLPRIHRNRDPWCWTFLVVGMIAGATLPHP